MPKCSACAKEHSSSDAVCPDCGGRLSPTKPSRRGPMNLGKATLIGLGIVSTALVAMGLTDSSYSSSVAWAAIAAFCAAWMVPNRSGWCALMRTAAWLGALMWWANSIIFDGTTYPTESALKTALLVVMAFLAFLSLKRHGFGPPIGALIGLTVTALLLAVAMQSALSVRIAEAKTQAEEHRRLAAQEQKQAAQARVLAENERADVLRRFSMLMNEANNDVASGKLDAAEEIAARLVKADPSDTDARQLQRRIRSFQAAHVPPEFNMESAAPDQIVEYCRSNNAEMPCGNAVNCGMLAFVAAKQVACIDSSGRMDTSPEHSLCASYNLQVGTSAVRIMQTCSVSRERAFQLLLGGR